MTYPPGSPGYPPAQQPTTQFAAPTQQFGKVAEAGPAAAEGPSKLPVYLTAAVAALGLAVYLSSFGPLFTAGGTSSRPRCWISVSSRRSLAALIAGVGLLPKQKATPALVAVLSVLGFLLVIPIVLTAPDGVVHRLGALPHHRVRRAAGDRRGGGAVVRCRRDHPTGAAAQLRAAAYGQYGGPGQYYGQPQHRGPPPAAGPAAAASGLSVAVRRRLPGRWPSTGGFSGGPTRAGLRRRRPASRPTASRRRARRRPPRCRRSLNRRHPRSPARRRRSLSRACVNFARVSLREERPN